MSSSTYRNRRLDHDIANITHALLVSHISPTWVNTHLTPAHEQSLFIEYCRARRKGTKDKAATDYLVRVVLELTNRTSPAFFDHFVMEHVRLTESLRAIRKAEKTVRDKGLPMLEHARKALQIEREMWKGARPEPRGTKRKRSPWSEMHSSKRLKIEILGVVTPWEIVRAADIK